MDQLLRWTICEVKKNIKKKNMAFVGSGPIRFPGISWESMGLNWYNFDGDLIGISYDVWGEPVAEFYGILLWLPICELSKKSNRTVLVVVLFGILVGFL